jgi:two-component system chemotaxis response regulator CheY
MSEGRVLVVDDEADVRKSVRLILSKAGYDVIEAEDGEAGVQTAKSGDNPLVLNAIICDLNMPKMSGMEAIPYFRSQFPSCPVIVLTGAGSVDRATTLFKQGVVEFLTKPIDQDKLLSAVKKAVAEGGWKDSFVARP